MAFHGSQPQIKKRRPKAKAKARKPQKRSSHKKK